MQIIVVKQRLISCACGCIFLMLPFERSDNVAGGSPLANILTLAAYERARRALRGVCEPTVAKATVFEPRHRLRQKNKPTARAGLFFLVEVAGFEPTTSSTRNWRATNCATPRSVLKNGKNISLYRHQFFCNTNIISQLTAFVN